MASVKFPSKVLEPIRQHLLRKEEELSKRKEELEAEDPFADEDRLKDNAAVDAEAAEQFGHQRVEAMGKEVDKALIRVRKALTRIKLGSYGECENCGNMIDTDRLAVDPSAQYCVACQKTQTESKTS